MSSEKSGPETDAYVKQLVRHTDLPRPNLNTTPSQSIARADAAADELSRIERIRYEQREAARRAQQGGAKRKVKKTSKKSSKKSRRMVGAGKKKASKKASKKGRR